MNWQLLNGTDVSKNIKKAISTTEPRISNVFIRAVDENNTVDITIAYNIEGIVDQQNLEVSVSSKVMAIKSSQVNATDLDFDTIADNIKTYLKGQEKFKDYNFEGGNLGVLIDMLATGTSVVWILI